MSLSAGLDKRRFAQLRIFHHDRSCREGWHSLIVRQQCISDSCRNEELLCSTLGSWRRSIAQRRLALSCREASEYLELLEER